MKKQIILFLAAALLYSCDSYLDVAPDNRAEVDSKEKIAALLVSAYPTNTFCYLTEMSSDNADRMERFRTYDDRMQEQFFSWRDVTETDSDSPQEIWGACYKAIASANQALQAIEISGNADGSLNPQKGEALLCRAYGHFVLVNLFCKHFCGTSDSDPGIPYLTVPETAVKPEYERGTVADVYAGLEADIEEGLPLINDDGYSTPKYHFNRKAAYAFAARFFLYYRKYGRVIDCATETLGTDPLQSLRNWYQAGITTNPDIRWNEFIDTDNRANLLLIPVGSLWGVVDGPFREGGYYMHNLPISTLESDMSAGPWGDASSFQFQPIYLAIEKVVNYKMGYFFEYTDPAAGIGYIHTVHPAFTADETLLCRAEAYALQKDYDRAFSDLSLFMQNYSASASFTRESINDFYSKAAYYEYNAATPKKRLNPDFAIDAGEQENFIHCILHIRRILTRSEGLRWFDIKRYGIEIYRRSISENNVITRLDFLSKDDPRRAVQLPMDVINAGLPANPR